MERHRIVVAVAIAMAPVAGLIGFGCSDDEPAKAGMTSVDPGGTFGAEVSIRVIGRGRVTGSIPTSIDCPGRCYVRYTFNGPSDRGAADGLSLKAVATPGSRFVGWTFENEQLGTKAKGPDICSPVKRASSQPGDSNTPDLKLTFGEVQGTAPPGQEGNCVGDLLKVPVAYKLLARFEDIPIVEAGPDGDADADAGSPGTVLFESPVAGATGGDIYLLNGRLYWRFNTGGVQGIASGLTTAIAPAIPQTVVSATTTIPRFEGDYQNVVFQQTTGTLGVFNSSNSVTAQTSFNNVPTCDAVESYYSPSTVFCLSGGTLYSWPTAGVTRTAVTGTVPATAGRNFVVTSQYFWVVNDPGGTNAASLQRLDRSTVDNDGGAATWTPYITAETNPQRFLSTSGEYLAWIEYNSLGDTGEVHGSTGFSTTVYTPIVAENGLRYLAADSSSTYVIAGVSPTSGTGGKIYRTSVTSSPGTAITPAVQGIPNLTGIAADSTYYYWTQNDGRVYRRVK